MKATRPATARVSTTSGRDRRVLSEARGLDKSQQGVRNVLSRARRPRSLVPNAIKYKRLELNEARDGFRVLRIADEDR